VPRIEATPREQILPKEGPEPQTDTPVLDLSEAPVKKLIRDAKKRGYVTPDQINSVLPSEEVNSEQIEDVLAMLSEMGIKVAEAEHAEKEEEPEEEAEEAPEAEGELVEVASAVPAKAEAKAAAERTDDPVRFYLRGMGSIGCSRARTRSPSPNASKLAARP